MVLCPQETSLWHCIPSWCHPWHCVPVRQLAMG